MNIEEKVKQQLLIRGFSKEQLLNNRGLIGAAIDEAVLIVVKNLAIHDVRESEVNDFKEHEKTCDVCGSEDITERGPLGTNCHDFNPIFLKE